MSCPIFASDVVCGENERVAAAEATGEHSEVVLLLEEVCGASEKRRRRRLMRLDSRAELT